MDLIGFLIVLGGVALIGTLTWIHLIMIASHYLAVKFGREIIEDYENKLKIKEEDNVLYA